jgi:hypothetical protein
MSTATAGMVASKLLVHIVSVINQFDGSIITLRDGRFGKTFMQNSVGIATDAVLH